MDLPTDPPYRLPLADEPSVLDPERALPETIPCLSMRQPWASLMMICAPEIERATTSLPEGRICLPAKSLETRSWKTPYRGPLLLHASKNIQDLLDLFYSQVFHEVLRGWGGFATPEAVPVGCLLGLNRLEAIFRTEQITFKDGLRPSSDGGLDRYEAAFGDYSPGRWAWHLPCPVPFAEPIPYRGRQSLFDVPVAILPDQAQATLHRWNMP